jgi:hypothetical protein
MPRRTDTAKDGSGAEPEDATSRLLDRASGGKKKKSGLRIVPSLAPGKVRPVPARGGFNFTELMSSAWESLGAFVELRFDPGMGRAMKFTAPVAGGVLHRGVRRVPVLYWLLGPLSGQGGVREIGAMVGLPLQIAMMERDPTMIPKILPRVRYLAKPAIEAIVNAAEKEHEQAEELAQLETRYASVMGIPGATIDHLILVSIMGMDINTAEAVLRCNSPQEIAALFATLQPPEPEPEPGDEFLRGAEAVEQITEVTA